VQFGSGSDGVGVKRFIYSIRINSRIQVFKNGKKIKTIPIPVKTFTDIDLTPDRKIVLLDKMVRKAV